MVSSRPRFDPYAAIDKAECSEDKQQRADLLLAAIDDLASHGDGSADVEQTIGYAWYWYPFEGAMRDENIEKHLGKALMIDPTHRYARLYLAHYYFDRKQYSDALNLLTGFSGTEFGDAYDQAWRDAKNAELIVCCKLYLHEEHDLADSVTRLSESLTTLEPNMNPEPIELTNAHIALLLRGSAD